MASETNSSHLSNASPLAQRVAVVTGAGRGLGRSHALLLAAQGATVVVNDLGTGLDGRGIDRSVAADVVAEISGRGGVAFADTTDIGSIGGGRWLIEATLARHGRIDIIINNAGFASGGGTVEMLDETGLDALMAVHLKGALGTMAAALPPMRAAGFGRIVNTVSEASLDPRFVASLGYAVAKGALWAATLAAAREVAGSGITVNAISPGARTRMSEGVLDEGFRDGASSGLDLSPEHVSRVVGYLASPDAGDINGAVIHAAGGAVREYQTRRVSDSLLVARLRADLGLR